MAYADYEFYKNEYFGNAISEEHFNRLALRASGFLDYYTRGKTKNHTDKVEVKMACCAVAEKILILETSEKRLASDSGALQSETVGSYSVSYQNGADVTETAKSEMVIAARQYLAHTGLLYRGGGCC